MTDIILIAGKVTVDAAKRGALLENSAELMRRTREQRGCLDYVWSADPTDPARLYVFERWACRDDLAQHLAGPCYREMRDMVGAAGLSEAEALKYRIDHFEPVYDEQGVPRADFVTSP